MAEAYPLEYFSMRGLDVAAETETEELFLSLDAQSTIEILRAEKRKFE